MGARSKLLAIAGLLAVLLASPSAEARFGKKKSSGSSGSSDSSSSSSSGSSGSSSGYSSRAHRAEPAGTPTSPPRGSDSSGGTYYPGSRVYYGPSYPSYAYHSHYGYAWGFGYYPWWYAPAPPPAGAEAPADYPGLAAQVGLEGAGYRGVSDFGSSSVAARGGSFGFNVGIEGDRLGFNSRFNALFARADDGDPNYDAVKMFDMHLSFAPLAGPHGRLRLEGGFNTVFAPDITMLGPDVGVSGVLGVVGPLCVEGAAHLTPMPFTALDAFAGVSLGIDALGLRLGWRGLYLNDQGQLSEDGTAGYYLFTGPYLGLALAL